MREWWIDTVSISALALLVFADVWIAFAKRAWRGGWALWFGCLDGLERFFLWLDGFVNLRKLADDLDLICPRCGHPRLDVYQGRYGLGFTLLCRQYDQCGCSDHGRASHRPKVSLWVN